MAMRIRHSPQSDGVSYRASHLDLDQCGVPRIAIMLLECLHGQHNRLEKTISLHLNGMTNPRPIHERHNAQRHGLEKIRDIETRRSALVWWFNNV